MKISKAQEERIKKEREDLQDFFDTCVEAVAHGEELPDPPRDDPWCLHQITRNRIGYQVRLRDSGEKTDKQMWQGIRVAGSEAHINADSVEAWDW